MLKQLKDQVLDLLDRAIQEPAEPPAKLPKVTSISVSNARIVTLETQLGVAHRLPIFNGLKAASRIAQLETLLAQKNAVAPAAPAAPAAQLAENADSILSAAAAVFKPTPAASALTAAPDVEGILKASLVEFRKMDHATRLQFAADGGALSKSDFDKLTLSAKSKFCTLGGKILDDTPASSRNISTAGRNFGQS